MSGWDPELAHRLLERAEGLWLDPDWDPVTGYPAPPPADSAETQHAR